MVGGVITWGEFFQILIFSIIGGAIGGWAGAKTALWWYRRKHATPDNLFQGPWDDRPLGAENYQLRTSDDPWLDPYDRDP